jgi:hypothetical protein
MQPNAKPKVKVVSGPKAACGTFIRASDKKRIYVFQRRGESVENAISRVKQHNGSTNVEHQIIQN